MTKCHAVQHADQMTCEICNLVWDVNDPSKPVCRPGDTGGVHFTGHNMLTAAPAPAEVPMPEPVAYGFGNTAITGHTNRLMMVRLDVPFDDQYAGAYWLPLVLADEALTYGERCRAAGEAAGYARGLKEAGRLISLWLKDPDVQRMLEFARDASRKVTSWPDRLNGEAEDALRREVKP